MHRHLLRTLLAAGLASSCAMEAQTRALLPTGIPIELQRKTAQAGTIFSGRVISIAPPRSASPDRVSTVTVTVQVESAIRGVKAAQIYSFREWAGLWSAGPRYRVGQHLLLFLYAPSKLGLTSPVGGASGVLPVDAKGRVLLPLQPRIPGLPPSAKTPSAPIMVKDLGNSLRRMRED
jgi:hypothetical protein